MFNALPASRCSCAALLLVSALLSACAVVETSQTESVLTATRCTTDADTFCVEGDKEHALKLNSQGMEYALTEDYDRALDLFNRAAELDPSKPEYFFNLGLAYAKKEMLAEEEATYLKGLEARSSENATNHYFAKIYFNLACVYALQGKKDQAFEQLDKLYTVDTNLMFHYIESDSDLANLREDPRYKELIARQAKGESSPENAGPP